MDPEWIPAVVDERSRFGIKLFRMPPKDIGDVNRQRVSTKMGCRGVPSFRASGAESGRVADIFNRLALPKAAAFEVLGSVLCIAEGIKRRDGVFGSTTPTARRRALRFSMKAASLS